MLTFDKFDILALFGTDEVKMLITFYQELIYCYTIAINTLDNWR